jgi:hypothetical protein
MNPSNLVLTKLHSVCDRLAKSGRLTAADSKEARDLHDESVFLIDQGGNPSPDVGLRVHLEGHAEDLAARMVDFLAGQLFPPGQGNADLGQNDNPDLDFRPVKIPGEPMSTTILRERR